MKLQKLTRSLRELALTLELRISRAWHFPDHFELQLGGMVQSTNTVFGIGPVLRWNFLDRARWRLFAGRGADLLQTGSLGYIVPWGKDFGYNFFPRALAGSSLEFHRSYWLETSLGIAHVTPRFGFGSGAGQLFAWSGRGVSLGLRHTFSPRGRH